MKNWRIAVVLLLCLVLTSFVACNPFAGGEPEATEEMVKVVRGDLTVTVSGSGNIEVVEEVNLAFGTGGKVAKIYVKEGDWVTKGEMLAQLETDDLELAVTQAEVAVTQAEVGVAQAEVTVTQAETGLKTAELELENAQDLYIKADVVTARQAVTAAKEDLDYSKDQLEEAILSYDKTFWTRQVEAAEDRLRAAEVNLANLLSTPDPEEVAIKRLQVTSANQSLALSYQSLELAQQSLTLSQQSLKQARKQLDEATVTATFDSVVASVDAKEGDIIPPASLGTRQIVHLIDLTTLELTVQVDEIDVIGVKPGQKANIEVDALSPRLLEGQVKSISPLPKQESGVIVYDVTISFSIPEDTGLKVGMSATADIVTAERSNVLLVPERAIRQNSEGKNVVDVMADGQPTERTVVVGISDGIQTEVLQGLVEGEEVVTRRSSTSSATGFF